MNVYQKTKTKQNNKKKKTANKNKKWKSLNTVKAFVYTY